MRKYLAFAPAYVVGSAAGIYFQIDPTPLYMAGASLLALAGVLWMIRAPKPGEVANAA